MKRIITSIFLLLWVPTLVTCADARQPKHQFKLDYRKFGRLTLRCDNCGYYYDDHQKGSQTVVDRVIGAEGLDLFSNIRFCGGGDTTPDGWVRITTDTGSVVEFGVLFPNQEFNPTLRIQSNKTGLGAGCSRKDQETFEKFFFEYIGKTQL